MKKIWKYLFLIVIYCMCSTDKTKSQNLVPNGSFEQQYSCPTGMGQADTCVGWHKFGGIVGLPGSPDYFDLCATNLVGVPDNIMGYQGSFEGSAYMGLYTTDYSYWYREYIGAKLLDTLIFGNNYNISMRVSRGNNYFQSGNCVASNKMGIRFTTFWYVFDSIIPVNNYAQVYEDSILTDTLNWILLNWNFTADSAYTHVYIGNFFETDSTDTVQISCPFPPGHAYYYIDSLNIVCTSSNCFTGINEAEKDVQVIFYNSVDQTLYIEGLREKPCLLTLHNEMGQMLFKRSIKDNEKINISGFSNGFYTAVLRSANKTAYKKIIKL